MSFWWVNHKQTANVEIDEGYIWSPKKNKNDSRNETYLNLKKATPGETIFLKNWGYWEGYCQSRRRDASKGIWFGG